MTKKKSRRDGGDNAWTIAFIFYTALIAIAIFISIFSLISNKMGVTYNIPSTMSQEDFAKVVSSPYSVFIAVLFLVIYIFVGVMALITRKNK